MGVKQINSLMKYLRTEKGIFIKGPAQKRKLRNIGYYHGYKGYRFYNTPQNGLSYSSFGELNGVYDFDMQLKTLFYPQIMFLETALKNYALEESLKKCNSDSFSDLYDNLLTSYKAFPKNSRAYQRAVSKRSRLHKIISSNLSRDYSNKPVVQHFCRKGRTVPVWAIFEVVGLGELGTMLTCMDIELKHDISLSIGLNQSLDSDAYIPELMIYAIKDLRNAVAHNDAVFDVRFQEEKIPDELRRYMNRATGLTSITFNTVTDYVILIAYMLHCFGVNKLEIKKFLKDFITFADRMRKKVPDEIFNIIIHADTYKKIDAIAFKFS